ncbi:transmembrane protein, putative (macronuclear) [Tetrahymena thermophila SB210]|uniref:Transmembrane protein, putative n=1 Tax=Tetrahymena thermophila (strain SB210) TaxID=312017 RepID=Q23CY0_TETTS|nr:transmembrane protein, putative [Tetrahymena thermophila SB210]EAR94716.1 transmembrane protein, putative [Tetrahymena thermophila SB210]|eukprot:XP_001014906.1 transmembrane protein, putative [Tetrahymena thermophila SB210]
MKKFGRNFIKDFDLFAKPFSFFVGNKKSKSTLIGGFLSLMIIGVSIYYFYYLMDLYFSNKIEPKITENFKIESNLSSIHIQESFFIIEMLINGQPLKQYEQQVNKVYLNYSINYEQYYANGTSQITSLPISQCTDSNFTGYLCIDQSAFQQSLDIYNNPVAQVSSDYAININPCDNSTIPNCATYDEIYELIFQPQNYFQIFTKIKQYNTNTRQFEDGYKSEYFYFDPYMVTYTRMDLVIATTTLTQGIVFQTTTKNDNIYNYQRLDTYFTKQGIQQRMAISGLAYIVYELNQVHNYFQIQEPMVTELLAQFMSIFNTLLIIGFLARLLAESHIVEDMNNILLKEYYKRTALRLVQRQQLKKAFQAIEKAEPSAQAQIIQSFNSMSKVQVLKEPSPEQQKSKLFVEINKEISDTNFSEQLSKYFNLGIKDRIKHFICSIFARNHKVDEKKDPNSDSILYANLLKQSLKRINIFEVYKDLIKIKMAIKLIMTKEQYAAMQFCGSDMCSEDQEIKVDQNKEQTKIQENENIGQRKISINNINLSQKNFNCVLSPDIRQSKKILSAFSKEKNNENSSQTIQKNKMTKFSLNSNQSLHQNCQSQNQVGKQFFSKQNQNRSKNFSDSEIILFSRRDQQTIASKNQVLDSINNLPFILPTSPKKQTSNYQERDNIQNLKCQGDQNVINNDNLSSNTSLEEQQKTKEIFQQNEIQNLKSHLVEMDKIESDLKEQEKYLNQFLIKMKNQNQNTINPVDQHIFQSLLINDQQQNKIFNFSNLQNVNLEKNLSIDFQPRLSKLLIDFQKNQNKTRSQII